MIADAASIMMVTYNRLELTKQTLENLIQVTNYPFFLNIIDNCSKDGTVDYLKNELDILYKNRNNENWIGYHCCYNSDNLGIAKARNQGLKFSSNYRWLSTIDNDVLLPNGWLKDCVDILTENPKYGMLGVNFEGNSYPLVESQGRRWQEKPRGNLGTACTVFNRSLHLLLGYFNIEYGLYGEEDADFGMRVRVIGLKMGYLEKNGQHLGEGQNDQGAYREFKTAAHAANLKKFNANCVAYTAGKKPIYIPFA